MNLSQVVRLLAGFTALFALAQLIPLAVALAEAPSGYATVWGFAAGATVSIVLSGLFMFAGRGRSGDFFRKEGLAVVGFAWFLAGVLGAVPFVCSGAVDSLADALFESVSGLTTTGASILGTGGNPEVESLPESILLWRALSQWMGGMGIVLVFVVLLPAMGVTGKNLLAQEQVGVRDDSMTPRMQQQARMLFLLYVCLTAMAGLAYWIAGMPGFDAVCHALTTMATGGFSTRNYSVGSFESLGIEIACIVFMFLAGCNFALLVSFARNRLRQPRMLLQNPEFRLYLIITVVVVLGLTASLWFLGSPMQDPGLGTVRDYDGFGRCLRDAAFQGVSILTSTGYENADFIWWPGPAIYLLVLCMLLGGCTGSTAGGLKVLRLLVCGKLIAYSVRVHIRPKSVESLKVGGEAMPGATISAILALVLLWLLSVALGTLVLAIDPRLDLTSAFTASCSMMGCTGPAITGVAQMPDGTATLANAAAINLGPYGGYGQLFAWQKVFMSLQMILGRLEILAPIVLFLPRFWKR